ncbi:translocase subunit SecD domain protein [Rhodococcus sp. MTM3W5.2]|nr:translocase subunit SecD domain protein [Rhodococcus sp. MTM3W5.2]
MSLTFKSSGSTTWAQFTAANIGKQAAFTLDSKVVSAPVVQGATPRAAPPRSPVTSRRRRRRNSRTP